MFRLEKDKSGEVCRDASPRTVDRLVLRTIEQENLEALESYVS